MIIGLTGLPASGKGTITQYLNEKHGAKVVKFSQPLRDIIHRVHKKETRDSMSNLAEFLRKEYGNDILVRTLIKDLEHMDIDIAMFDGIRYFDEYDALQERKDFILWAVDTDLEKRHSRVTTRGENAEDTSLSLEEFKKQHELPTEVYIPELMKKADFTITNNGTFEELYEQVEETLKKSKDAIQD